METSFEKINSHPHAENMKLYAGDAAVNAKPWKSWEFFSDKGWVTCAGHPAWTVGREYRRKPKTININGFEVPSPLRNPPNAGEEYYVVDSVGGGVYSFVWHNVCIFHEQWLKSGLIHKTKEAAELHLKALLSFTQQV